MDHTAPPPFGVHLTRTDENVAEIDALAGRLGEHGGGRVGVTGLLGDLDRRMRRTYLPHPRLLGRAVDRALTWERRDRRDLFWYPQGISTSVRTGVERDVLVTSWYSKRSHGSRVSFIDLDAHRYRHVLLVEPTLVDGVAGLKPLKAHAGGIVWHGPYLHVAATGRGFLTCRTDDLLRVPAAAGLETFGHEYVLPVRFAYRASNDEGVTRLRFSFMTLDRSTDPPSLVVGEYGNSKQTRRLARFPTDAGTGLLATGEDGVSRPVLDGEDQLKRMQGTAVVDGTYFVTSSHGRTSYGQMHVGTPETFRDPPVGHAPRPRGPRLLARHRPAVVRQRAPRPALGLRHEPHPPPAGNRPCNGRFGVPSLPDHHDFGARGGRGVADRGVQRAARDEAAAADPSLRRHRPVGRLRRRRPPVRRRACAGRGRREARRRWTADDVDQALADHPRIGERPSGSGASASSSAREQAGVDLADTDLAAALRDGNAAYEEKFGRIYLVRAKGRTGPQLLALLRERLTNDPETEEAVTTQQLREIALLRMEGLFA